MKYGCCLNMVATQPDGTGIEKIEALKKAGFDYVELPTAQMSALSDNDFVLLVQRVKNAGIPCETSNNLFPVNMRLTGPNVNKEEILLYARKAFARDEQLGIQYCVFGSGPAKNVPDGFSFEKAFDQVVDLLHMVAPVAKEHGIGIVIEPLRKAECNLINTFAEGVNLAKAANESNVKVLVDYYHLIEENEPVQHLIDDGKEYLRHVHIANPDGRVYLADPSESGYSIFADALKKIGYDGRISCEAYLKNEFEIDAPVALKTLKTVFE